MTEEEINAIAHMLAREALEGYRWEDVAAYAVAEGLTLDEALEVQKRIRRAKVVVR